MGIEFKCHKCQNKADFFYIAEEYKNQVIFYNDTSFWSSPPEQNIFKLVCREHITDEVLFAKLDGKAILLFIRKKTGYSRTDGNYNKYLGTLQQWLKRCSKAQ